MPKKYGIYRGGKPVIIHRKDRDGNKITEHVRAGTKGAARRLAKRYGGEWRNDGEGKS